MRFKILVSELLQGMAFADFGISPIDALPEALGKLPHLREVYISQSDKSAEIIEDFRSKFPQIAIETI